MAANTAADPNLNKLYSERDMKLELQLISVYRICTANALCKSYGEETYYENDSYGPMFTFEKQHIYNLPERDKDAHYKYINEVFARIKSA
jgi:hypothetical protein